MSEEKEIFKGKTFDSLLKDIYDNSKRKESQIQILITELKPMIKNIGDAVIIVPLIKDYMEIAVKNDEALIKMAAIVQKAQGRVSDDSGLILTEDEKKQLIEQVEKVGDRSYDA
jgi:esterase/lipase